MLERKIIHIDMDSFFASVEQRDNTKLKGQPIAVGSDTIRGVVSTASYEARLFGVRSAMSVVKAKQLCPQLILVPPRFNVYKEVSKTIHEVFHDYTELIEPLSLDEAFLDITACTSKYDKAINIAKEIKEKIQQRTQLTASAGVSYNKFLAKIASDYNKPNGLFVLTEAEALDFIDNLVVERFWGIGRKTALRLHDMGIFTGKDLKSLSQKRLIDIFGKPGNLYYNFSRGIDNRAVHTDSIRKSVGCECTFEKDLQDNSSLTIELYHLVLDLVRRIEKTHFKGKTLTLKVKYADFHQITRSVTSVNVFNTKDQILPVAKRLLFDIKNFDCSIRLMGLSISNPSTNKLQEKLKKYQEGDLFIDNAL